MANEIRRYYDWVGGLVEDNPLASSATTLTSAGLAALPAVGSTEHVLIVFDPDGLTGAPFAKRITAHTAAATTATIEAAAVIGTARSIDRDTPWVHAIVSADLQREILVVKAADESVTSSAALQDDNELTFPVASGELWVGEFVLFVTGDAAGDILAAIGTPTSSTGFRGITGFATGVAADNSSTDGGVRFTAVSTIGGTTDTGNGLGIITGATTMVSVKFSVTAAAAGNIYLRWAQAVSNATATTIKAGSYVQARRVYS